MDIKEIIKNLEHYNNWRRDNDNEYTMPEPKQIGITIDATISELNKLLICDVVSSLPTSKDRISELEKAIIRWDLKNDINDKQAFSCGWNNCYRWIKDFVRQKR